MSGLASNKDRRSVSGASAVFHCTNDLVGLVNADVAKVVGATYGSLFSTSHECMKRHCLRRNLFLMSVDGPELPQKV